jgi:Fe-S-cluster-containing dehydrogenase component/CRP-like cAMP-binding protein
MTTTRAQEKGGWPRSVFSAALLRGLDERGRQELSAAGRLLELASGDALYRAGERGNALYVVASGALALSAAKRTDEREVELRRVESGDSCGEEACVGATFRSSARAAGAALVAELPVAMVRRALVRAGGHDVAERIERRLRRKATAELLATLAFTAELPEADRELLLDAAEHRALVRGEVVYRAGEPASHLWLVADGMVQLQTEDDERLRVRAYLVRGDFFGDDDVLRGTPRSVSAVASGASLLISIPAKVARTVADRNPEVLRRLRRVAADQESAQHDVMEARPGQTQHAFRDLYRLQVARSLLVIDLDSCVRCGHCAWSCEELHGVARLVRRGDKIVARVGGSDREPAPLMLPNSCQHCDNPACMVDCPTGAIGRDPRGEVYIRAELCTGCGACAKACPWDNIQMVPRPDSAPRPPSTDAGLREQPFRELAVKCDLCRDYDGPACVKSCPTEAIFRLHPSEELPDIGRLLRRGDEVEAAPQRAPRQEWPLLAGAAALAAGAAAVGIELNARGAIDTWRGPGLWMGVLAAVSFLALIAYVVPKRGVRWWSRRRSRSLRVGEGGAAAKEPRTRSLVAPQLRIHVLVGLLGTALALTHGGARFTPTLGGALLASFVFASATGLFAMIAYALVPRRLARIERRAALPEDFAPARRERIDRLYRMVSGKSEVVKRLFERVLVPYLRRPFGWIALLASGRSLGAETRALRARIDRMLEGRGSERLAGLDDLIDLVVELRALRAQRVLTASLRLWLPIHLVAVATSTVLLVAHVIEALG